MMTCQSCGTEYEDYATYCNNCDVSLESEIGEPLEGKSLRAEADSLHAGLEQSVRTAATMHRMVAGIYMLALLLLGVGAMSFGLSDMFEMADAMFLGVLILIIAGFFVLHLSVARGLLRRKGWARQASIVLALLLLTAFPIGTIFGAIILSRMFGKQWRVAW